MRPAEGGHISRTPSGRSRRPAAEPEGASGIGLAQAAADDVRARAGVAAGPPDPGAAAAAGAPAKPRLRGWIHAVAAPGALAGGIVLTARAPSGQAAVAAGIFAVTAVALFTVSAIYHLGTWSPRVRLMLRRLDHANILLIIAGTYTPLAVLALHGGPRVAILSAVWGGAVLGVVFRLVWTDAPRWAYVPLYLGLGWAAAFVIPQLLRGAGLTALVLIAAGGVLYTLGGVAYGLRRPDPWPRWFGFHEVFHACTVAAFACQYIAVSLAVYQQR